VNQFRCLLRRASASAVAHPADDVSRTLRADEIHPDEMQRFG
jgi:hypothetical protein